MPHRKSAPWDRADRAVSSTAETSDGEQRLTDACLAAAVRQGDPRAAAALYDAHGARLYGLALAMLCEPSDAEAVLVEAFADAWREIASFAASRETMRGWLTRIVYQRSLDTLRARRTPQTAPQSATHEPDYELQLNLEQPALSRAQSGRLLV